MFSITANAQNIGSLKDVVTPGFSFTLDLLPGYTDAQVLQLQKVLNADPDTTVSLDGEGSKNKETKYFGNKTKLAVIKFQEKYRDTVLTPLGLTQGTGNVSKITRTRLNLLIGEINTYDSVGSPESRGQSVVVSNSTSNSTSQVVPVVTTINNTSSGISVCQFIDLLVNIGIVPSNNANQARIMFGCQSTPNQSTISALRPSVDIRANGKSGTVTIDSPRNVTVSWTSENVTSCQSPAGSRPISGSGSIRVDNSGTFVISCTGPYGTVTDSVSVKIKSDVSTNNLNPSCIAAPGTINSGGTITWVNTSSGTSGNTTYSWSGNGLSGSGQYASKIYTATGTTTATINVTSGGITKSATCSALVLPIQSNNTNNTSSTTSSSTSQTFAPSCVAAVRTIATGDSVVWVNTSSGTSVNATYSWSGPNGISGNNSQVVTSNIYTNTGTTTATINVTSGGVTKSATCSASVVDPDDLLPNITDFVPYCSVTSPVNPIVTGTNVSWVASIMGSDDQGASYLWSGSEGLFGTGPVSPLKSYLTVGTKQASVAITLGGLTKTAKCDTSVVAPVLTPSISPLVPLATSSASTSPNVLVTGSSSSVGSTTNKALSLSGEKGAYVSVNNSSSISVDNQITLEAWVKPTSWRTYTGTSTVGTINTILVKGKVDGNWDYWLGLDAGKIYYSSGISGRAIRTCSPVVPLNTWSHISVSISETGNSISMYLNGNLVPSLCSSGGFTVSNSIGTSNSNLYIGNVYPKYCSVTANNYGFTGLIDDVRIWNKARTSSEIKSSTTTLATSTTGTSLAARWNFDNGFATDLSGNVNNGSLFGVNSVTVQGSPRIITANDSPSVPYLGNVTNFNSPYSTDIACIRDVATTATTSTTTASTTPLMEEEGQAPKIPFIGIVTEVEECEPRNASEVKLWQVAIKACVSGDWVTGVSDDGGLSSSGSAEPGYIVIREGMQPVPEVGDSVLGEAVPDHGQICENAVSGEWIGTVTGALDIGGGEGENCIPIPVDRNADGIDDRTGKRVDLGNNMWDLDKGGVGVGFGAAEFNWSTNPGFNILGDDFLTVSVDKGTIFGLDLW